MPLPTGHAVNLPARDDIRRILIMRWSALGDVTIASAIMEDIYRAFPGRELHLNVQPPWDRLFADDPRFSRILAINLRGGGWRAAWQWLRAVRAGRYDLIIDLQSNDRSRLMMTLLQLSGARVPCRLGNHRRYPYNLAPDPLPPPVRAFDHLRATLRSAGIPTVTPRPVLHVGVRARVRAAQLQAEHGLTPGGYAVFMPGCEASGHLKRWGARQYAALALRLHDAGVPRIALIGANDDLEVCAEIAQACGNGVANLCCRTELLDILPLCEDARCIVSNDTGTAHLASATARPIVIVCGPTDPRRVKPAGDNVVALQADIYCRNCYRKHCTHHSCMQLISPEEVFAVLMNP